MRYSRLLIPTLREDPAEAEVASHRLMLRAGMVRRLAAGIYCHLPLGYRALQRAAAIVRQEMVAIGGQEVLLPALQPAEIWRRTGRWDQYGREMFRLQDRHGRDFCLGPTHEEVITELVRLTVRSWRQLPLLLFQIQPKFRDEPRPRFGLMRAREFLMKDAYSFDLDEVAAEEHYRRVFRAYERIFERCGVEAMAVEAESGLIGGSFSHEFMAPCAAGEDVVVVCSGCPYAANRERAELRAEEARPAEPPRPLRLVSTPGRTRVEEVATLLGVPPQRLVKTLLWMADGRPVAVLLRGDHELNEAKLRRHLGCQRLELADGSTVERLTGAPAGFSGPVGLQGVPILADWAVAPLANVVVGANRPDAHYLNANPGRDFQVDAFLDLRMAEDGDPCPRCGSPLRLERGMELGHTFKLGTKYSEAMGATVLDERGRERPLVMGCYGIGLERILIAALEQHHDEAGIVFPRPLAPFEVLVLPTTLREPEVVRVAERVCEELEGRGVEVLLDDREESAGVKFKDADLLGIPLRITVGPRSLREGRVELWLRKERRSEPVGVGEVVERVVDLLRSS